MIQAHVLDSWTRTDVRGTTAFAWSMIVAGFGAPLFLFLAGVSVGLSAGSKSRRTGDDAVAAAAVMKRGGGFSCSRFCFGPGLDPWLGSAAHAAQGRHPERHGPSIVAAGAIWAHCAGEYRDSSDSALRRPRSP
jgi:hypothetical protein